MIYLIQYGNSYTIKDCSGRILYTAKRKIEWYYNTYDISFFKDEKVIYRIKQKPGLQKFLANTIGLSLFLKNPYIIMDEQGVDIGTFYREKGCYKVSIYGHEYAVRIHTASYVSLWKDGIQIGLMKRKNSKFKIILDEPDNNCIAFNLLLTVFATCVFLRVVSANYGYCIVFNDKYKNAVKYITSKGESM